MFHLSAVFLLVRKSGSNETWFHILFFFFWTTWVKCSSWRSPFIHLMFQLQCWFFFLVRDDVFLLAVMFLYRLAVFSAQLSVFVGKIGSNAKDMPTARSGMLSNDWVMINVGGGVQNIYVRKGTTVWCGNIGAQWMHPGHGKPNNWFMMKRVKPQLALPMKPTTPKTTMPMKSTKSQVMKRIKCTKPKVMKSTKSSSHRWQCRRSLDHDDMPWTKNASTLFFGSKERKPMQHKHRRRIGVIDGCFI